MPTSFAVDCSVPGSVETVWEKLVDAPLTLVSHPSVLSAVVISSTPAVRRSAWELDLRGSVLHLTVSEELDHDARQVNMRLLEGDLLQLSGTWGVRDGEGPAADPVVTASINGTFGLPLAGDVIDAHLDSVLRDLVETAGRHLALEGSVSVE